MTQQKPQKAPDPPPAETKPSGTLDLDEGPKLPQDLKADETKPTDKPSTVLEI